MLSFTDPAMTPAEATAYIEAAGGAGWPDDTPAREQAIMRGQRAIAAQYNGRWLTEWENDAASDAVKHAIAEAALIEARSPGALNAPPPDKVLTGAKGITWQVTAAKPGSPESRMAANIAGLLAGLVAARSASVPLVRV